MNSDMPNAKPYAQAAVGQPPRVANTAALAQQESIKPLAGTATQMPPTISDLIGQVWNATGTLRHRAELVRLALTNEPPPEQPPTAVPGTMQDQLTETLQMIDSAHVQLNDIISTIGLSL